MADCVPGVASWEYECVCDKYGDGKDVCKVPEGCEPGADDAGNCSCFDFDYDLSNITASWNDTDTCYHEVQLNILPAEVGSWVVNAGFDQDVDLLAVWNAVNSAGDGTSDLEFRPKHWNMNQAVPFNFHITTPNQNSGCPLSQAPTVRYCSSPVPEPPTDDATPIDELIGDSDACFAMTVSQNNAWESGDSFKQNIMLQVDLDKNVKEWYVQINANDTLNSLIVWNMQYNEDNGILIAEKYNRDLWAGLNTWSGEIDINAENVELTADICFQRYE